LASTNPEHTTRAQPPGKTGNTGDSNRLPCRGCTRECGNFPRCNGKPWRM
jgi:hypothetical protein